MKDKAKVYGIEVIVMMIIAASSDHLSVRREVSGRIRDWLPRSVSTAHGAETRSTLRFNTKKGLSYKIDNKYVTAPGVKYCADAPNVAATGVFRCRCRNKAKSSVTTFTV